jgi:DNA-binding MarR family transcriptional regulator
VVRALAVSGPLPIRALADAARVTHSAASQTVAQMRAAGLVRVSVRVGPNADGRERRVALTPAAKALLPALGRQWAATNAAAAALEAELSASLTGVLLEAAAALERRPFAERIREAARTLPPPPPPAAPPSAAPAPARGSRRKAAAR